MIDDMRPSVAFEPPSSKGRLNRSRRRWLSQSPQRPRATLPRSDCAGGARVISGEAALDTAMNTEEQASISTAAATKESFYCWHFARLSK
jgi:hypothetical protein